jgi:hypothetical protein
MITSRPISASMASITASLVNAGGTKATDTSAPVSLIASATEAEYGQLDVVAVGVLVRDGRCRLAGVDAADDVGSRP